MKTQLTNFEHYEKEIFMLYRKYIDSTKIISTAIGINIISTAIGTAMRDIYLENFDKAKDNIVSMLDWYAQPYKEPKNKGTQFEYDLLRTNDQNHNRTVGSFNTYLNMRNLGYFKDVNFNKSIKEALENWEMVE